MHKPCCYISISVLLVSHTCVKFAFGLYFNTANFHCHLFRLFVVNEADRKPKINFFLVYYFFVCYQDYLNNKVLSVICQRLNFSHV